MEKDEVKIQKDYPKATTKREDKKIYNNLKIKLPWGLALIYSLFFLLVPSTIILLISWLITKRKIFGIINSVIWLSIFGLIVLSQIIMWLNQPISLNKKDYYGTYVVNRKYFKGY